MIKSICCVITEKDTEKSKYLLLILTISFTDSGKAAHENGGTKRRECGSHSGAETDQV